MTKRRKRRRYTPADIKAIVRAANKLPKGRLSTNADCLAFNRTFDRSLDRYEWNTQIGCCRKALKRIRAKPGSKGTQPPVKKPSKSQEHRLSLIAERDDYKKKYEFLISDKYIRAIAGKNGSQIRELNDLILGLV